MEELLRIERVALIIDVSIHTINYWYRFKKTNPDNEYAKMLPDFIQNGERQIRYWKESDIEKLLKFKESIPHGKNGIMGSVTQKYLKKEEKSE